MEYAEVLRVLADPTRIKIMELLSKRSYCVGVLGRILDVSAPAVSQHMKILQAAGLVCGEKIGYHTHYSIRREALRDLGNELVRLAETVPEVCERQGMRCGENGLQRCANGCPKMAGQCGTDRSPVGKNKD